MRRLTLSEVLDFRRPLYFMAMRASEHVPEKMKVSIWFSIKKAYYMGPSVVPGWLLTVLRSRKTSSLRCFLNRKRQRAVHTGVLARGKLALLPQGPSLHYV